MDQRPQSFEDILNSKAVVSYASSVKTILPMVSAITLAFGIVLQLISLVHVDALQFFSWNQVLNDAISFGGMIVLLAVLLLAFRRSSYQKYLNLHFDIMLLLTTPVILLLIADAFEWIAIPFGPFSFIVLLFFLLAVSCFSILKLLDDIKALQLRTQGAGLASIFRLMTKAPRLNWLFRGLRLGYMAVVVFFALQMGVGYYLVQRLVLIKTDNRAFFSTYMNDGFVFVPMTTGRTLVLPRVQIQAYYYPYNSYTLRQGLVVFVPNNETLKSVFKLTRADIEPSPLNVKDFNEFQAPVVNVPVIGLDTEKWK